MFICILKGKTEKGGRKRQASERAREREEEGGRGKVGLRLNAAVLASTVGLVLQQ